MKKYEHYTIEDFLKDELFVQWCYDASPELSEFWQSWCEQYTEKVPLLQKAKEIIQSVEYKVQVNASEEVYNRILQQVLQSSEKKERSIFHHRIWQNSWKVAVVLIILTSSVIYYLGRRDDNLPKTYIHTVSYVEKYCPVGKKMTIVLNDGTKVRLNADTYLRFPETFEDSIREIQLVGEAFFEVMTDPQRPFVIRSQHLQTTVLGTSFNVQAYPDSKKVDVAVAEGLVKVAASEENNGSDSIQFLLSKGEKVTYTMHEDVWAKEKVQVASIGRWRNWELVFEQENIVNIARKLERWYGVKVIIEGPFLREVSYSGTYTNNTLFAVLEGITYSTKLSYSLQGDTVYIKP